MKINVGSKNDIKVNAVREVIRDYDFLVNADVLSLEVSSEISDQPKSIDETILGAMNRAKNAFQNCDYSFGIEDGLINIPKTKTGYMNVCVCAIYDGQNFDIGLSPAFEYPCDVIRLVFDKGMDINQAFYKIGLTKNPKIGSAEGAIGILSNGRLLRKEYTKQAIIMALIRIENSEKYY